MNWFPKRMVPLAAVVALAIGVAGAPGAKADQNRTLTVAVAAGPHTMDPLGADVDSNLSVMSNVFDALVERDAAGKLHPALATEWKRIDELTWRLHLRKGVKYQNGDPFTWDDVAFTMKRAAEPKISEFQAFGTLVASVKPVNGDPWTIDIKTTKAVPFFIQTLPLVFIMDKESTEKRSPGEVAQKPIGTGPYRFVEWVKGSYLKLEANPDYWGKAPAIKTVELRPITEASTRLAAIVSGSVDILQDVPVALIKTIERNPKVELVSRPARRSIYLSLANKKGTPTADLRVRKAMAMAINENEIISRVMFGHASPAAQIPDPPTVGYSKNIKRIGYNLEQAKKLMAEAGYPNGFSITLTGPNDRYVQDAQIEATVAAQLAKIGIKVTVDSKPKAVFFPEVDRHELDFYLIGWFDGSYDFGRSFSKLLHTVDAKEGYGGLNGASYRTPKLDELYEESTKIVDPEKRAAVLRKLNETAADDVAIIPLHYQEDDYAVAKGRHIAFTPRSDTWIVFKEISYSGS